MTLDQVCQSWQKWFSKEDANTLKSIAKHWQLSIKELLLKLVNEIETINLDQEHVKCQIKWFLSACEHDSRKSTCAICGRLNLFFDDCGYFYQHTDSSKVQFDYWPEEKTQQNQMKYIPACCHDEVCTGDR